MSREALVGDLLRQQARQLKLSCSVQGSSPPARTDDKHSSIAELSTMNSSGGNQALRSNRELVVITALPDPRLRSFATITASEHSYFVIFSWRLYRSG